VRFPPRRFAYGAVDPGVVAAAISAVGGLASSATEVVGGIEIAKVRQATEERTAQTALEIERLAADRARAEERRAAKAAQATLSSALPYVLGGVAVTALVVGGVYAYRSRRA